MPVLDSDWSVFSLFVEKLTIFIFKLRTSDPFFSLPPELAFQEGDFDSEESAFVNSSSDPLIVNRRVVTVWYEIETSIASLNQSISVY